MDSLHTNKSKKENMLPNYSSIIKEFFQTDKASEIIESLNKNIESILFTESIDSITPEMRVHIANQLRVATLLSKLEGCYQEIG
ncbi:hypothetical protein [Dyadobacter fanqingshengii]|uniref:Uncharacterized protein n=1 Tax=Dyadobacter fanqingshengii TaxID=2906443 RepID=A0A9X1PCM7_9BACT|nr:hypothetical protein [Dyadobacter fanqingshengii]MCF0042070.1 hypothetical protein [Dyadobacter fanqingshengii]USJ35392.1 hypothetical protein NFI81_22215 [Dyadobacter fanqingshengii]